MGKKTSKAVLESWLRCNRQGLRYTKIEPQVFEIWCGTQYKCMLTFVEGKGWAATHNIHPVGLPNITFRSTPDAAYWTYPGNA